MLARRVFNIVKSNIPKISPTELIALNSGNTSLDRSILNGKIDFLEKPKIINKFPQNKLNNLLNTFDNSQIFPNKNNNYWINFLAKEKYFSFLIDGRIQQQRYYKSLFGDKVESSWIGIDKTKEFKREDGYKCGIGTI